MKSPLERSVDSLERTYAVIIALAIGQAVQTLIRAPIASTTVSLGAILPALPAFVAFLVTLVPFFHGMNRHLERSYLEKTDPSSVPQQALVFDFVVFFLEAGVLFGAAWSLRNGLEGFIWLGALLIVDVCWGLTSHLIHNRGMPSSSLRWAVVNVIAIALAVLIVEYDFRDKAVALMAIAVLRTIADYVWCRDFYFPPAVPAEA